MIRRILINTYYLSKSLPKLNFNPRFYYTPSQSSKMMKKSKDASKNKKEQPEEKKSNTPASIYGRDGKTFIVIDAKPNSKVSSIVGVTDEGVRVNIGAPPKEGEANKELVEFLASALGVRKTDVSLDKGSKSKSKIIVVEGIDPESAYQALQGQIE